MSWWLIFSVGVIGLLASDLTGASSAGLAGSISGNSSEDDDSSMFTAGLITTSSSSLFDDSALDSTFSINPANGLPMVGCVDVCGNPYGSDASDWHDYSVTSSSIFDDHFSSSCSMFDDHCSSGGSIFDDHFSSSSSMFDNSFSSSSCFND